MKHVWGLGAAVLSLLLVVIFWTVYVTGRLATTERLAPSEMAEGIEVPVIGTVGDFPEPETRIVLNVTAENRVTLDGVAFERFGALVDALTLRGDAVPGEVLRGTNPPRHLSDAGVLLRVDGSLPWGSVWSLMQACAESGVWRISFAVRHEGDGADGALGFPLPRDTGACEDPQDIVWKEVQAVADGAGGSPDTLHAALAESPSSVTGKLAVRLAIDPRLPTRTAFALIDAAIRTGAQRITLTAPRRIPQLSDPLDIAKRADAATAYSLRIGGTRIEPVDSSARMASVVRVHGAVNVPAVAFRLSREKADELVEPAYVPWPGPDRDAIPK